MSTATVTKQARQGKKEKEEKDLGLAIVAIVEPYKKGALIEVPVIEDEAQYIALIEFAKNIKAKMGKVDEAYDDLISSAHQTHKAIIEKKKSFYTPLATLFSAIERRVTQYRQKKEYERQQQEKRLQQQAQENQQRLLTEEAAALEQEGRPEEASEVLQEAMNVPAPLIQAPSTLPTVSGAFSRKGQWKFEIKDSSAIRDEYWSPDLEAIAAVVKAKGLQAENLIGKGSIRVFQETKTVIMG